MSAVIEYKIQLWFGYEIKSVAIHTVSVLQNFPGAV